MKVKMAKEGHHEWNRRQ
jgi:hypothetical protein